MTTRNTSVICADNALNLKASYFQEEEKKGGFMATVGDPETPDQDVFCLCFLRLLLIQPPHSTATTITTKRGSKLTLLSRCSRCWWFQSTRPALSSPSFSDDRSSIRFSFSLLSLSLSVISDLFLNRSYKLFHILISYRCNGPRFLSSLMSSIFSL